MPWRTSRPSVRFIVCDQHNTAGTTRELGFGARKHGAPTTGLAHRASPPPNGSVISNKEAGTTSSIAVVRQTTVDRGLMAKSCSEITHLVLKLARSTPGQIANLAARPQHESGDPHPRFDAPPESLDGTMRFPRRGPYAHAAPHSLGAWLDFARKRTVARAQHPESGRTARNGHQKRNQRI